MLAKVVKAAKAALANPVVQQAIAALVVKKLTRPK